MRDSSRIFEIGWAAAALVFWSPLILLIVVSLTAQTGPLVERGQHVTVDGRLVQSIRFRSSHSAVWRAVAASGLDALPQYFDVIRGRLRLGDVDARLRHPA